MSPFIELLQVALETRDKLSRALGDAQWTLLYSEAQKQAVVGILLDGIERLPEVQRPPQNILLQWIGTVYMVETTYRQQCERAKELTKRFSDAGYPSCVLKGLGFAQYYPKPARRQGGA